MENINKEQLDKKMESILKKETEYLKYIEECEKGIMKLQEKRTMFAIDLSKVQGEKRVIKEFLDLLTVPEPPKKVD